MPSLMVVVVSPIDVVPTHDIMLAEIAAGLHFDELGRDRPLFAGRWTQSHFFSSTALAVQHVDRPESAVRQQRPRFCSAPNTAMCRYENGSDPAIRLRKRQRLK